MKNIKIDLLIWVLTLALFLIWLSGVVFKINMGIYLHIDLFAALAMLLINLFRIARTGFR